MLLSFFREASCPFCNFRVFELTHNYRSLSELGLDVVVVFSSDEDDIRRFIARQPRPFRMVADPDNTAHQHYGIESSFLGKLKAMMLRMPAMLRGMRMVGMAGMATGSLMPADFLIDEQGRLQEAYYGEDAGDHIPMERVELFAARGMASARAAAVASA
jgi:peroxiredoxin